MSPQRQLPDLFDAETRVLSVAKATFEDPEVPIVLMTGFVSPALSARARELGVAEVIAKPLVSGDIARSLAGALRT